VKVHACRAAGSQPGFEKPGPRLRLIKEGFSWAVRADAITRIKMTKKDLFMLRKARCEDIARWQLSPRSLVIMPVKKTSRQPAFSFSE
jgi:hypothetical protein